MIKLLFLLPGCVQSVWAALRVAPTTHAFTCRYAFTLPAGDATTVLRLSLHKSFRLLGA